MMRFRDSGEVYVIVRWVDDKTHHFMDVASSERLARESVTKTFPTAQEEDEEIIGQFGVSKKVHYMVPPSSRHRDGLKVSIHCMEPNRESMQLE